MARAVQSAEKVTISGQYVGDRAGRYQKMTKDAEVHNTCQDNEKNEMAIKEFDVVR